MPQNPSPRIRSVCLALPAYNEAAVIVQLLEQAVSVLAAEFSSWSIVVVDDGSKDQTAALVESYILQGHPEVQLVRHEKNRGLGPAIITCLQAGLGKGSGPEHMVVCMDADLTHPPTVIPLMRRQVDAGADMVIASRFQPGSKQVGVPFFRRLMSVGARLLFKTYLSLPGIKDYTCGFRAFRASLLEDGFKHFGPDGLITRSGFACTDELLVHLAMLGPQIREVPFILRYDLKAGCSKMNLPVTIIETIRLLRTHRALLRRQRHEDAQSRRP